MRPARSYRRALTGTIAELHGRVVAAAEDVAEAIVEDGVPRDVAIWAAIVREPELGLLPSFAEYVRRAVDAYHAGIDASLTEDDLGANEVLP